MRDPCLPCQGSRFFFALPAIHPSGFDDAEFPANRGARLASSEEGGSLIDAEEVRVVGRDGTKWLRAGWFQGDRRLRWKEVVQRWCSGSPNQLEAWNEFLARAPFPAYFFETPPTTSSGTDQFFEFVLVDAPSLVAVAPDPRPFSEAFRAEPHAGAVMFPNLGGDAVLVSPTPQADLEAYTHLAVFQRRAPAEQRAEFWRVVGEMVGEGWGEAPRWLSTSGLGVFWLHMRHDTYPKYYTYGPYRDFPFLSTDREDEAGS